jgi:tetratricopeptide (TPR) repeat protein
MPTKLSRYCEGVIEAAWLAAVILVPLFFDIYSSRIFEPDKITILRSLALLILGAWIVKVLDEGGIRWERINPGDPPVKFITKTPLLLPILALAVLYIVATMFSVTPRASLWGSYQRLQGTYSTLSYLVVFAAILGNLRKRSQVERLITTIILVSLPIALYGILQRYEIDPVPWGGDTSKRIASNMGNSIFVAAYLVMVFPITILRIVRSFAAILREEERLWTHVASATIYVFIASVQVIALYMSQSRGPALGWLAGSFFLFLLLSLHWNKRWLTIGSIGLAGVMAAFLFVFNISGGPLESLRNSPAIGRFGSLLDAESNSALVRKYIWQGAADLVSPHEPIEYPDGSKDRFNTIRPIIGYGPESMYVAYNPFYVPELAHVEKRNASPDRAHNETWDALVITGVLGILVYLALFTLVFYYGLKWLGLIADRKQRNLFLLLIIGFGAVGAVGLSLWRSVEYFGVGLPFGMLIGLLLYITLVAIFASYQPSSTKGEELRSLTLIVLIAAVVSHFVEINFGIAIAVTRTYFWTYAALLVAVGYILPMYGEYEFTGDANQNTGTDALSRTKMKGSRKKKRKVSSGFRSSQAISNVNKNGFISAIIISTIIITLGFNFISNPRGLTSALDIIWAALTRLPNQNFATSFGVFALIITSWVAMGVVMVSEGVFDQEKSSWWKSFGTVMGISILLTLVFWFWHAGNLATIARNTAGDLAAVMAQVGRYQGLLTNFYLYIFFLILLMAGFLIIGVSAQGRSFTLLGAFAGTVSLIVVIALVAITNLRVIQADIAFKLADPFTRNGQWPVAISIYDRANELAPNEDYYYLFLGRAYLEHAKTIEDIDERDRLINQAEKDLEEAQKINPLNTDHTANLARLYSLWSSYGVTEDEREEMALTSADYFSRAVTLSPKNARIWDEWALLYLNILNQPQNALDRLNHALEIDPGYHWTYALLGEYYSRQARELSEDSDRSEALAKAAETYTQALALTGKRDLIEKHNYGLALGGIYVQQGRYDEAIMVYLQAIDDAPNGAVLWRVEEAIASLYAQQGDSENALLHVINAFQSAPEDQRDRLQNIVNQLQTPQP